MNQIDLDLYYELGVSLGQPINVWWSLGNGGEGVNDDIKSLAHSIYREIVDE